MSKSNLKVCVGPCKLSKPYSEFNKNKCRKDGYNSYCRMCSNAHGRVYYRANQKRMVKQIKQSAIKRIRTIRQYLYDLTYASGCIDCGENNPVVLEFDHRCDKIKNISILVHAGQSLTSIKKEVAKCDIRCANCHRKKTAVDFNWYKDLVTKEEFNCEIKTDVLV